jgi:phage terminase large subunit-like protein
MTIAAAQAHRPLALHARGIVVGVASGLVCLALTPLRDVSRGVQTAGVMPDSGL